MNGIRVLFGEATTWVVVVPPRETRRTPACPEVPLPVTQNREPSSVAAPRMLLLSKASPIRVLVSIVPSRASRPTTRLVPAEVVLTTLATPGSASYPARARYWLSSERFKAPSATANPLFVRRELLPETDVGK